MINGIDSLKCQYGCSGTITRLSYLCTDYSSTEDWSFGEQHLTYNFSNSYDSTVTIGFSSCCWVSYGTWNLSTTFSLVMRSDIGKINSSPRAIVTPVLRLQGGCNHTIMLPVSDPDNDIVRCRWAVGKECSAVCHTSAFVGATLDSNSCTIKYNVNSPSITSTLFNVAALMIEDFIPGSSQPLSSVALQFVVLIVPSTQACSAQPQFTSPTLPNGVCISIPPGTTFTTQVTSNAGVSSISIIEIQTVSPFGTNKGNLQHVTGTNLYYVNVTWTPQANQQNQTHQLCYVALNSVGVSSPQHCVQLAAGYLPPAPNQVTSLSNQQLLNPTNITVMIEFDRGVQRPSVAAYIIFYEFHTSTEVYRIDTSKSSEITFNNLTATIAPNYLFTDGYSYYATFDRGVVQGIEGCGATNDPIMDKTFWMFAIRGNLYNVACYITFSLHCTFQC